MNETITARRRLDAHLGCYGNFAMEDPLCKRMCALRIRCAIERDQKERLELLEEWEASTDGPSAIVH